MAYKKLNENHGIVRSMDEQRMVIILPRGGTIEAPITEGIRIGDSVAFLVDDEKQKVAYITLKKHADEIVARSENHLLDVANREQERENYDNDTTEIKWNTDESVFCCPDLGQF